MDSRGVEQTTRPEQMKPGQWIRPCAKTEKYEKLKPVVARSYQLPDGETVNIHFIDLKTPENIIATPRRKKVEIILMGTQDNQHYEVSARLGANPSTVSIGVPDSTPGTLSFESWEPEYPDRDMKPNPFTCTHMDMDEVEIKIDTIKL